MGIRRHVLDAVSVLAGCAPDGWARIAGVVMRCLRCGLRPVDVIRAVIDLEGRGELHRNAAGDARLARAARARRRAMGAYRQPA